MDWERDCEKAIAFLQQHKLRDAIVQMYCQGPPENQGFHVWTDDSPQYKAMETFVLDMGYDSSGYALMQRKIQSVVKIVRQIYAITTMALQMGYMPTDPDDIMAMLKEVPATRAEICNLARKNLLEWIYFQDCGRSREEYRANMNKSMAKYLQQTPEVDEAKALGNRL